MERSLNEQALEHLRAGNDSAATGQLEHALVSFNAGLKLLPASTGLLLNRSIIFEQLDMKAAAFDDLMQLLKGPRTLTQPQQAIAFKRLIALGLTLARTKEVLACLQHLEPDEQWQSCLLYTSPSPRD